MPDQKFSILQVFSQGNTSIRFMQTPPDFFLALVKKATDGRLIGKLALCCIKMQIYLFLQSGDISQDFFSFFFLLEYLLLAKFPKKSPLQNSKSFLSSKTLKMYSNYFDYTKKKKIYNFYV